MSLLRIGFRRLAKDIFKPKSVKYNFNCNQIRCLIQTRKFCNDPAKANWDFIDLTAADYDRVCSETLEGLCDYFEELVESTEDLESTDVAYSDGVLNVNLGYNGTYVINRQTPNKQVWLSSPRTGPKRFDFFGTENAEMGEWIYKHTGESMHSLLQNEIADILKRDVNFYQLPYAGH